MNLRLIVPAAAIAVLVLAPVEALATDANGNHETYTWEIGAVGTTSATAVAADGSTITMSGSGMLNAGPLKSVTGGGTYSMSGGGSGTWTATDTEGLCQLRRG